MSAASLTILNLVVAGIAALAAIAAAWISYLAYRRTTSGDAPVVSAHFEDEHWFEVAIENFTTSRWLIDALELRHPGDLRGNTSEALSETDAGGSLVVIDQADFDARLLADRIPIGVKLYTASPRDGSLFHRRGDVSYLRFYLTSAKGGRRSMRLVLRSLEGRGRKVSVSIVRTPPAVAA